ncbi:MAG: cytochrome c [Microthrixaceae bacterium]
MPANGTRTGEHLPNRHRTHRHHNRIGSIRITLTALATVLCATTAVTACGGSEQSSDSGTGPADIAAGEQVYADRCATCHGRDFRDPPRRRRTWIPTSLRQHQRRRLPKRHPQRSRDLRVRLRGNAGAQPR